MRRRRLLVTFALLAAVAGLAVGASGSTTSVTITSPRAGQSVSLKKNPYLAVAGAAAFAPATAGTTRFYLRRDGCGTSNDNPHLSVTSGTDAGDGCGLVLTIVGAGGDVDKGAFVDYPSQDGMPLAFDGTRNVTGTVDLENFSVDDNGIAAGLVTVDVTLEALVNGSGVTVGSDSESVLVAPPTTEYPVSFTIAPNSTLDRADLSGLDLRVHVHGPYAFSGFIGDSGKSFTDVPSYAASLNQSVRVSLDDASLASSVPARIDGSSWSVALPTPPPGKHTLYAQSTQGFDSSAIASQTFTVTK